MSNFDEEAERERLRKKYEQDSAKREETQRMSELLLQGATMTNSHCDTCGSPIFRYDGQEFCPNCQHEDNQKAESATEAEAIEDKATESASASASASSIDNGAVEADPSSDTPAQSAETPARAEQQTRQQTQQRQAQQQAQRQPQSRNQPQPTPAQQQTDTTASAAETAVGGTRSEAAEALLESITYHARMATQTNDPHRAITHLEAASEAADAWEVFK